MTGTGSRPERGSQSILSSGFFSDYLAVNVPVTGSDRRLAAI
jgi:hypothetical protein